MAKFDVTITEGTADRDGQAARDQVNKENDRRAKELAGIQPPPDPVPAELQPLPLSPAAALLTSYEIVFEQMNFISHESYVLQAASTAADDSAHRERYAISTDAQRQASTDALEPMPE